MKPFVAYWKDSRTGPASSPQKDGGLCTDTCVLPRLFRPAVRGGTATGAAPLWLAQDRASGTRRQLEKAVNLLQIYRFFACLAQSNRLRVIPVRSRASLWNPAALRAFPIQSASCPECKDRRCSRQLLLQVTEEFTC